MSYDRFINPVFCFTLHQMFCFCFFFFVWECFITVFPERICVCVCVCQCVCDSEAFVLQSNMPLNCLWAKAKNKTIYWREWQWLRGKWLRMSQCTCTKALDLLLYTQDAAYYMKLVWYVETVPLYKFHLCTRYEEQELQTVRHCFATSVSWQQLFLL